MPKVTIENAPKTLKESLERAVSFLEENDISSAVYENENGDPCLIGSYFTKKQRAWIIDEGLNDQACNKLVKTIGEQNLTAMTGMSPSQCSLIQSYFDSNDGEKLKGKLLDILSGRNKQIDRIEFNL